MEPIPLRVLLVEDNPDDAEILQAHMEDMDGLHARTDAVERLSQALERLRESEYDVVMLDLSLPDAHGLDSIGRVREVRRDVPIIIMTGLDDQNVAFEAARHGAQDYLVKGRGDADLIARSLRYAVERARTAAELCAHRDRLEELVAARTADLREKSDHLQLLATAIEGAAEAMFITDARLVIQYVNPAFETLTGYSSAEITGQTPRILRSDAQTDAFFENIYESIKPGVPWRGNIVNRRKDGSTYTSDVIISGVAGPDGVVRNYVYMGRDVSEELRLRERLNRAQRLESVGQLAGGIAHDFNNILQAIIGYAQLSLDMLPEDSEPHHNCTEISGAARRAADLTRQLLAFSRRQLIKPAPVDLNQVIQGLLNLLRRVLREDIDLDFVPGHSLGTVEADIGQVEQILMNLCVNARDAMPRGGRITIETENVLLNGAYTEAHPWARPGRFVLLSVTDTGEGMPPHVVDKIFEPFFTTKQESGGTGLGLATVYGVVKQHQGFIHCYSEVGKGTTFKIYLAMSSRRAETVGPKLEGPAKGGTERILVAEDDAANRALVVRILERAGYTCHAAADGRDALDQLNAGLAVDLVISDVVMPRLGGIDLYTQLRAARGNVRMLLTSGYSSRAIEPELLISDNLQLVQKPYSPDELLRKVRQLLDKR